MTYSIRELLGRGGLLLTFLALVAVPVLSEIPSWLGGTDGVPLWVSADEAISGSEIRWELLPESARRKIERQLELSRDARLSGLERKEGDPCWAWYSAEDIEPQPSVGIGSPQHLARLAELTLVGKVTDSRLGFYNGWPATVFEVSVEHSLKLPKGTKTPAFVYVARLGANIPIGKDFLCFTSSRGKAVPQLGGRILVALEKAPESANNWLLWPGDHEMFFDLPNKSLSKPTGYTVQSTTFDELVQSMTEGEVQR